jgi:uncharacterized protein (DUF2062 family)/trans-aconitate methyltransferase
VTSRAASPPAAGSGRRRFGQVFAEIHYRLRTEGDSPSRQALAVWLGVFIGCIPVYGAHLILCFALARVLGLNRITTYLAAHINNPLTAPFLLYGAYGIGGVLTTGQWPQLDRGQLSAVMIWQLGRDILIGSAVLGVVLGVVLGAMSYAIGIRWKRPTLLMRLFEATSRRYLESGIWHWEFARGKLKRDPLYLGLLTSVDLPQEGRLLDLGCGRGLVPALLATARTLHESGEWDAALPAPPPNLSFLGVEGSRKLSAVARSAVGGDAQIETADLLEYRPPPADVVLLLDVLHYLPRGGQDELLGRLCGCLEPGGLVVIREADAAAGWRFVMTRLGERICAIFRGRPRQRFAYRSAEEWGGIVTSHGLEVTKRPMSAGTPFGNVLVVARASSRATVE